jgi:virginiamycin B lyase
MRLSAPIGILGLCLLASPIDAATISGTVTGPDGAPFRAAFVQARHAKMRMTVSVLTDNQGKYTVENLPAGEYRVAIRAVGFKADPKSGLNLTADQNATQDFALQKGMVRWADLSILQGIELLPNARGKDVLVNDCMSCHGFQSKMAATVRDADGWRSRVEYMREAMRSSLADRRGFSDQQAEDVAFYINEMFGQDSVLPKSPAELPNYKSTVTEFPDEALKIVYVDYEMPGPDRFPWTAHPDKDGTFWIPQYGSSNRIAHFNPATGEMKEYRVPNPGPALIHSAVPAPDGSIWVAQAGSKKLGRFDPKTGEWAEYPSDWRKHTIAAHPDGTIWSTGGLTRFDPKTSTYTKIPEVPTAYGIGVDKEGTVWFTQMIKDGIVGKVDPKTLKVTKYIPPHRDRTRRMQIDSDGSIWFAVYDDSRIGRFDPKTETFKDYALPVRNTKPYGLGIATDGQIWYSSYYRDVMGRLDPASGKVVEYPMPYADNGMRDFFLDKEGRTWFASPPNNRVGYFYISNKQRSAEAR